MNYEMIIVKNIILLINIATVIASIDFYIVWFISEYAYRDEVFVEYKQYKNICKMS